MTNEELALAIKQGKTEYTGQLWEQVEKLISYRAKQYICEFPENYEELLPDMVNESYFAMLEACEKYDPDRGAFTTCLWWYVRNAFQKVLYGGRGSKAKNEPLNNAMGLEELVPGSEDLKIIDTLLDEESQSEYWSVEDMDFYRSINSLLSSAIDNVKNVAGAKLIRYMLRYDATVKTASEVLGYKDYKKAHHQYTEGIQQIRKYMYKKVTQKQLEAYGIEKSGYEIYMGVGLNAFKKRSYTSAVEHAVIKKVDGEMRNERLLRALRG